MLNEAMPIDLHTHVVPHELPAYAGRGMAGRWPSMSATDCGRRHLMIGGKNFRTIGPSAWDAPLRLRDMADMRISMQVLSPMPELLSYWLDAEDTLSLGRNVNACLARMAADHPGRFIGFGMVPLQDPHLAARELERLRSDGLSGVEIGTNVNGRPIGDPMFEPFFAAAEALELAIFVHALRPAGTDRLIGPPGLEQAVAFPCETGLAIASLITAGMLERHPRLKLAFSHGGGAFGLLLPRLAHIWNIDSSFKDAMPRSPRELARTLYFDTLVYDVRALSYLIECFGATQLMLGTDYPFAIYEREPYDFVRRTQLPGETIEALLYGNAARFLGLA